ncbi:MAG TPA: hypothetical protein VN921_06235 [Chthoniobacterales bacterium]|nr:hypothetical protein [Chthoniobacterales bacterium]
MKLITRSTIALVFLIGLATPLLAQNPNLAIHIAPPPTPKTCFPVTIKNLRATPIVCNSAYVVIFDQSNCKRVCEFKMSLPKNLAPCQSATFTICCAKPLPPTWIVYVAVHHNFGMNEEWLFRP